VFWCRRIFTHTYISHAHTPAARTATIKIQSINPSKSLQSHTRAKRSPIPAPPQGAQHNLRHEVTQACGGARGPKQGYSQLRGLHSVGGVVSAVVCGYRGGPVPPPARHWRLCCFVCPSRLVFRRVERRSRFSGSSLLMLVARVVGCGQFG